MSQIAIHAACMAAGVRDGLRTAQFYARDMTNADGGPSVRDKSPTALSKSVAAIARGLDSGLSRAADISVQTLNPGWRNLPSPFELSARERLAAALTNTQATLSSEFTRYFFRSARIVLEQWADAPHLVLEHRIEFVRRNLQREAPSYKEPTPQILAQVLVALVEARPIARTGKLKPVVAFLNAMDINSSVFSTACLALLLAQEGKLLDRMSDDDFLAIVGQLIHNHMARLSNQIIAKDQVGIAQTFSKILEDY